MGNKNWRATLVADLMVILVLFGIGMIVMAVKLGPTVVRWLQGSMKDS